MRYISTRGAAPVIGFDDALLTGLARDGGLYVPEEWPQVSTEALEDLKGLDYPELAVRIMRPFVAGSLIEDRLPELAAKAYESFGHKAVVPLVQLGPNLWMMEQFHGPTLAFKDVAMQLLGQLFDAVLEAKDQHTTIVGATSGDTGAAAIEACRGRKRINIVILHPKDRVSEVQRRQMTTVQAPNVRNLAIEGTFDDCQDLLKAMFNDQTFRQEVGLSAVNSINWARVMAQIVYYFAAGAALGTPQQPIAFSVPTGNFGNVFAGYAAMQMGLPVSRLIIGSNANDILTRFFASGEMSIRAVRPSYSPSMDIQVSSNFERFLFDLYGRDGAVTAGAMTEFRRRGVLHVNAEQAQQARGFFQGYSLDDDATLQAIRRIYEETEEIVDPHSAIGIEAAHVLHTAREGPVVCLATAHPAKFPDAVEKAIGRRPDLPPRLSDLYEREEAMTVLPNDLAQVQDFVRGGPFPAAAA